MRRLCSIFAVAVLAALSGLGVAKAQLGPGPFAAFPSQSATDGRFLGFGCAGLATFEQNVQIALAAPASTTTFDLNIFDGDTGALDGLARRHWDLGTRQLKFSLYADPLRVGSTLPTDLIGQWFGNDPNPTIGPLWTSSSATMPDNAWWAATVTNAPIAQAPSGNYFYNFVIETDGACGIGEQLESSLKIAASNPMNFRTPRFGLVAGLRQTANDVPIIYPGSTTTVPVTGSFLTAPTTYDGTFEFFFTLPGGETELRLFDGDFDYGTSTVVGNPSGIPLDPCFDQDDPDTNALYLGFPFLTTGANLEGVQGAGSPPDDNFRDIFRRGELGDPSHIGCVRYEVTDPEGNVYFNDNPSGSFEWEQFLIASTDSLFQGDADWVYGGATLPAGMWKVTVIGLDLANLNFWYADTCATRPERDPIPGEDPDEVPRVAACSDESIYLLGDFVWADTANPGVLDPGEAGIPGVLMELVRPLDGAVIGTAVTGDSTSPNWAACVANNTGTDTNGLYCFGMDAPGTYTVRVAASNFGPGGALEGKTSTTGGDSKLDVLLLNNVLTYDFGYDTGTVNNASVGDRVWFDSNGDGIQDSGEAGINGVTVELLDHLGNVTASQVTSGDGNYLFGSLAADDYMVRVVASTLPTGLAQTYDLDGISSANITSFTLAAGQDKTNVDFGYRGTGSIGDRVWLDGNGNTLQDSGEAGINGVTVELLDNGGNVIDTQVTSGDGHYTFSNLDAGSYTVRVVTSTLPAGVAQTYDLDGIGSANMAAVSLTGGQSRMDVDFGYRGVLSVGDRVWLDFDANGAQDGGEAGINGVTVELLDGGGNVIASQATAGDGNYTFGNLVAGNYSVRVVAATLPAGLAQTYDLDGLGTAHVASFSLNASRTDVDFGYRGTGSLGDRLWLDFNADGSQDVGEIGINGVTVELLDNGGNVVGSQITSGDGGYTFGNLPAGNYSVRVVASTLPAGLAPTYDLDGIASANIASASLAGGQNRSDVDFGYRGTGSIGDRVWIDFNNNGIQDVGEAGLNGVTVTLLDGGGNAIATQVTAGDGIYTFGNLPGGAYAVRVEAATLPPGLAPSYDLDGIGTANIALVGLAGGQNRTDVDFGYRGAGSIGDRLWLDFDADGTQDVGEAGINGVTVSLLDENGNVLATQVTSGDGNYTFSNLPSSHYSVRVEASTLPAGIAPSYDLDGISSVNFTDLMLGPGQNRTDVDFGYKGIGNIGDRIWLDEDGNGLQDVSEFGINGVTLELLDNGGTVIATTSTTGNGNYSFPNLPLATYSVRVVTSTLPNGLAQTFDLDGTGTAHIATLTLTLAEAERDDVDFGYRGTGSIGDRLWIDTNGNGVQDSGETGLNGVSVSLLNAGNVVLFTAITSGNGNYTFSNLSAGSYSVRVESSTLPAGLTQTYDLDGVGTANIAAVSLSGGQNRTDVDFGYRGTGSLGDRVWIDGDGDGAQDLLETGINGVTVNLLDGGGNVIATDVTAGDGLYQFQNLVAGTYSVQVVSSTLPAGLTQTFDLDGLATPHKATVALAANQSNFAVDFGYRGTASLGDRVWTDTDGDGIQDAGELGINGVDVILRNSSNNVVAVVTTSGDGGYLFPNLLSGSYTVSVDPMTVPAGMVQTYDLDGVGTANTTAVSLAAGQTKLDVDFGYRTPPSNPQCVDEAINDPAVQGAGANHAFWLPGIGTDYQFTPTPGSFIQNPDGTANMNGTLRSLSNSNNAWTVSITFTGRTTVAPAGSPKKELKASAYIENGGPVNPATWIYYTGYNGTLTGLNNNAGAVLNITRVGPAFQVGVGANGKNLNFGASGWYKWTLVSQPNSGACLPTTGQGDINVDIVQCPPTTPAPGTGTIGYWKTHASSWPVSSIKIGNQTYTVSQAITLLGTSSKGDKSIDLAKQLIAAKLNVLVGNVSTCINSTITSADNWLKTHPVGSNVRGSSSAWSQASMWHDMLDDYNNGLLCAPHRN